MGFKENLRSELEYNGMMIKELAEKSGIKRQTLDNYLSTHNAIPNADIAVKIAQALGTSVEYLITGKSSFAHANLPPDIAELVRLYKALSTEKQQALMGIVRVM